MKKRLLYIACLLALAACAKVEPVPGPVPDDGERKEIAFRANMDQDGGWVNLQTKADVSLDDLKSGGWGLYGYYTKTADYTKPSEAVGVLFNGPDSHGRQVRWDSTNSIWDYSYVVPNSTNVYNKEYWPMDADEKVSFFAYAPYSDYSASATVDAEDGPQVTYTATTDMSAQKDLLWGTSTSGLPHRNVGKGSYPTGTVDMHFRHAPAKIHFTINGATLGDKSLAPVPQGTASAPTTSFDNDNIIRTEEVAGGSYNNNTLYYAYRKKIVTTTQNYRQSIDASKILLNSVDMTNFIRQGTLYLNNKDSYIPYWTYTDNDFINYSFNTSTLNPAIINPKNETTLSNGWETTYSGVDLDPIQLLPAPDTCIYMVPKTAVTPQAGATNTNITITVSYDMISLKKTIQFTRTTQTISYQRVRYYMNGDTPRYRRNDNDYRSNPNEANWEEVNNNPNYPSKTTFTDGNYSNVNGIGTFDYSQDHLVNGVPKGFTARGSINTDIIGGRDYTVNLYLDGRELKLTVIPQPWDLHETTYDYNGFINPVEQSLTYDANFVYDVVEDKVYINNRMGKFYFRLGTGTYLYWQASLIGDDAFAFTDENGEYLRDNSGNLMTSIRGDLNGSTSYIYVKAINTASRVTSQAKLRIYLFNSENHAVVALPKDNWLFVSSTYSDAQGNLHRVQEWTVVQTAN